MSAAAVDVIAHPDPSGIAFRRRQLESDRLALLAKMELERFVPVSPVEDRPPRFLWEKVVR